MFSSDSNPGPLCLTVGVQGYSGWGLGLVLELRVALGVGGEGCGVWGVGCGGICLRGFVVWISGCGVEVAAADKD